MLVDPGVQDGRKDGIGADESPHNQEEAEDSHDDPSLAGLGKPPHDVVLRRKLAA